MSNKSSKFKASHILISSLVALIITFFVISDKIALLDNLAVLIAIWSIPVLILLITVIRDLILPKMNNETIKFKSKDTLITSLVALIITFFITADKIAQNMGIARSTLNVWLNKHSDISEALKKGREPVTRKLENALINNALGFCKDY